MISARERGVRIALDLKPLPSPILDPPIISLARKPSAHNLTAAFVAAAFVSTAEEELIPAGRFSRLLTKVMVESPVVALRDIHPLGFFPLRAALACQLEAERGVG